MFSLQCWNGSPLEKCRMLKVQGGLIVTNLGRLAVDCGREKWEVQLSPLTGAIYGSQCLDLTSNYVFSIPSVYLSFHTDEVWTLEGKISEELSASYSKPLQEDNLYIPEDSEISPAQFSKVVTTTLSFTLLVSWLRKIGARLGLLAFLWLFHSWPTNQVPLSGYSHSLESQRCLACW